MKRKKSTEELSNGDIQGTPQKRTRSQGPAQSTADDNETPGLTNSLTKKRSSCERDAITRDNQSSEVSRKASGVENDVEPPHQDSTKEGGKENDLPENVTPLKRAKTKLPNSANGLRGNGSTPTKGKNLFSTPTKFNGTSDTNGTPTLQRHADRSARWKTTRSIIERTVLGNTSDNDEEDEELAQHIYGSEEEEEVEQADLASDAEPVGIVPATPSKRGRKKGSKNRKRSPTPPQNLPPHELYFSQNRPGRSKTSNNTLASLALLDHEEYFTLARAYEDPHAGDLEFLQETHALSFNQWYFELSQGFNICLYGWGSKRSLLMRFAEYIYEAWEDQGNNKIVVVNGYAHNLTIRDVLNTVAAAVSEKGVKLGSQPAEMLERLMALLEEESTKQITIVMHSIDGMPLRRSTTQAILSRLSSHPQIHLVASADHPSFPLLWDSSLRSTFDFLFHDCTTFQPYGVEVDVVDEVHELLGRSGRRVGGKEGVSFVLKSLPENAKNLFRVLIGEQLAAMDDSPTNGFGIADDDDDDDEDNERQAGTTKRNEPGVEYRVLYQKAVEEFICSNEMNFRTLLKELVSRLPRNLQY